MRENKLIIDALAFKKNKSFGFQEYLFNLLDYFYKNRNKILVERIIVVCDSEEEKAFDRFKDYIDIKGFKVNNLLVRFFVQSMYPYLLNLKKSDVILFTGNFTSWFKKCKYILVIHDLLFLRKRLLPNLLMRIQRSLYIPRSLAIADAVIAISEFTKKDILQNYKFVSNKKIIKIYNYFNFEKYEKRSEEVSRSLIEGNYFLCVSSLAFHKNVITVIRAFEKYCQFNSFRKLVIIGNIPSDSAISNYIDRMDSSIQNRIQVFSCISNIELSKLYASCDAYISATLFEGLGMPIVEAMYFNVPLIISDIEVCREVTDNNAIFFNPNSYMELADIFVKFKSYMTNSRSLVLEKFSNEETSQKYIEEINRLINI